MEAKIGPKRKNSERFTEAEMLALTEAIRKRSQILFGSLEGNITNVKKAKEWADVVKEVNMVSTTTRTKAQCHDKWKNMKKNAKSAASHNKKEITKTGGGVADLISLDQCSQNILATIPNESIFGIKGGFDTSDSGFGNSIEEYSVREPSLVCVTSTPDYVPPISLPTSSGVIPFPIPTSSAIVPFPIPTDDLEEISDDENDIELLKTVEKGNITNEKQETPHQNKPTPKPIISYSRRRRRAINNPAENLLARQVDLFGQQLEVMKDIAASLKRRNEIEEKKLELKRKK